MPSHRNNWPGFAVTALLALAGCNADAVIPADETTAHAAEPQRLGLMTSLPLYWPESAAIGDLASGRAAPPWQRGVIEQRYTVQPLDTLSPISALSPDAPEVDPLAGLQRLAVIQPRGLSPADNVALDRWVRAGGRLLLVLDPALTGEYAAPLGDPRRPVETALILPVVKRWGLNIFYPVFDRANAQPAESPIPGGGMVPLAAPGMIDFDPQAGAHCKMMRGNAIATCRVGKGQVTLIADAAVFEHPELAGEGGATLRAVLAASLH